MKKPGLYIPKPIIALAGVALFISIFIIGGVSGSLNVSNHAITGTETLISTTRINSEQENPVIYQDRIVWQGFDVSNYTFDIILYNLTNGKEMILTADTPDSDQINPAIYGDLVVWEDGRNGYSDIFEYNLTNQEVSWITQNTTDTNQAFPAVNGDRIVWQDNRNGSWDVYLYDLLTENETQITDGSSDNEFPDIYGTWVVWQSMDLVNMTTDIMVYNIQTGITRNLISDSQHSNREYPKIWGENVVWQEVDAINSTYDVYLCNLTSGFIQILTPDTTTSNQMHPRIENNRVVWEDDRDGKWNIYSYELSTGTTSTLPNDTYDRTYPAISGDRIVWQDMHSGLSQIYLFTLGNPVSCPQADFEGNNSIGALPLTVYFSDKSTGNPINWNWDFGDGTSGTGMNVTHVYNNSGIYTVTLTVSTPYCRDSKRIENLVTAGGMPEAQFSVNTTEGPAPLTVGFIDESSGEPTDWIWEFGDGTTSTEQNPEHTYPAGLYTVRLTSGNEFGNDTIEKENIITVVNGTPNLMNLNIMGLEIQEFEDKQHIVVNTTLLSVYSFNRTEINLSYPQGSNLRYIRFFSENGTEFLHSTNSTIEGNISGMHLESEALGQDGIIQIGLDSQYYSQNGSISLITWENMTPLDLEAAKQAWFNMTIGDVTGGAYTAEFIKNGIGQTGPATIRMAVNSSWITEQEPLYGMEIDSDPQGANVYVDGVFKGVTPTVIAGTTAGSYKLEVTKNGYNDIARTVSLGGIRIIRIGDDGISEVLPTRYLYSDPGKNLDYFEADSPDGLSKFSVVGLSYSGNPFQLLVLSITRYLTGGGGGGGGGGGSSSSGSTIAATPSPTATESSTISSTEEGINPEITLTPEPSVPQGEPTTLIPEEPATPVPTPTTPPPLGPLGIIIGMFGWLETVLKGRMVFILAAVAITVVSVIAIWKKGYLGRE
jgi:beta propeller repeat protein